MKFDKAIVFVYDHSFDLNKSFWDRSIDELPNTTETHNIRDKVMNEQNNCLPRDLRNLEFIHQFHDDKDPYKYRVFARVQTGTDSKYLKTDVARLNSCFKINFGAVKIQIKEGKLPKATSITLTAYDMMVGDFPSKVARVYTYQTYTEEKKFGMKKRSWRMSDDEAALSGAEGKFN